MMMKDLASPADLSASRQVLLAKLAFLSAAGCNALLECTSIVSLFCVSMSWDLAFALLHP